VNRPRTTGWFWKTDESYLGLPIRRSTRLTGSYTVIRQKPNLPFKPNTEPVVDLQLNFFYQRFDIPRRGISAILDPISVFVRYARAAYLKPF